MRFKDIIIVKEISEVFGLFATDATRDNVLKSLKMTIDKIPPGLTSIYDFKKAVVNLQKEAKKAEKKIYDDVLGVISHAIRSGDHRQVKKEFLCKSIKKIVRP